jgi:hypothetical protein
LRKSSLLLTLVLLLVSRPGFSEESRATIEASRTGERFSFSMDVEGAPEEAILRALREGMRSEVEYRVQLYREAKGIWRFFGDRLIEEYETHHIAYFDPFTRSYRLDASGAFATGERSFERGENFLDAFLSVTSNQMLLPRESRSYRLRGRAIVRPVRVAPPLGLIGVFLPREHHTTAWVSLEL